MVTYCSDSREYTFLLILYIFLKIFIKTILSWTHLLELTLLTNALVAKEPMKHGLQLNQLGKTEWEAHYYYLSSWLLLLEAVYKWPPPSLSCTDRQTLKQ